MAVMNHQPRVVIEWPDDLPNVPERPEWQARGNCREMPVGFMYPPRGDVSTARKAVCEGCPVREECLEYALEHNERYGIWGGMSERQRRRLRAERSGRQRQHGTNATYGGGCQCDPCKAAHAAYQAALRGAS